MQIPRRPAWEEEAFIPLLPDPSPPNPTAYLPPLFLITKLLNDNNQSLSDTGINTVAFLKQ